MPTESTVQSLINQGDTLFNRGLLNEAISRYEEALKLDPNNSRVLNNKALALKNLGRLPEALAAYDEAIKLDPNNEHACFGKANILDDQKKHKEALRWYDEAIRINPRNAAYHSNKGGTLFAIERFDEAATCFEAAAKINPKLEQAYNNMGSIYIKSGKFEQAIQAFSKANELNPRNYAAIYNKALAYVYLFEYAKALECCDAVLAINPSLFMVYNTKGNAYMALGKYKEAFDCFKRCLEINPNMIEAIVNKGIALAAFGKMDEAIACFDEAIIKDPNAVIAYHNKGCALYRLNKFPAAIKALYKALNIQKAPMTYVAKAASLNAMSRYEEALADLEQANAIVKAEGHSTSYRNKHSGALVKSSISIIDHSLNVQREALIAKIKSIVEFAKSLGDRLTPAAKEQADELVKEAVDCFKAVTEQQRDQKKEIDELTARIEAFEREYATKAEVSYAIKMNPLHEAMAAERSRIEAEPKLKNYYRTFCAVFNQSFVATMAQASGRVALQPKALNIPIEDLGKLIPVPFISEVAQAICTATNMALKIYEGNNVRRLASLAMGISDMEEKVETTARKITLSKQAEIMAVTDQSKGIAAWASRIKSKMYFDAYNTPEKKLAVADATRLLMSCMAGRVDAELDLVSQFVMLVKEPAAETKLEKAVSKVATVDKVGGAAIKAGSAAEDSGCCVVMKASIIYDNPVLNDTALIEQLIEKKDAVLFKKVLELGAIGIELEDIKAAINF
jgi:tetratricopeptide (TPR) repeat protein